ncbi:MAG: hypothetical protein JWL76_1960 [Thermoleophilia bacterium]|nr:hypothetical protein [Thermoleophilia bacterium]
MTRHTFGTDTSDATADDRGLDPKPAPSTIEYIGLGSLAAMLGLDILALVLTEGVLRATVRGLLGVGGAL